MQEVKCSYISLPKFEFSPRLEINNVTFHFICLLNESNTNFFHFSDSFLNLSLQEVTSFLETEEECKDVNKNCLGKEDALFVKSEDTLVSALLQWVDYQTSIESSDEKKHLLIKRLIQYINWNDVSEKTIKEFSVHYPSITQPGKYVDNQTN